MQFVANSLIWSAELGLVAIGFGLSYRILGFANFILIELVTVGAYVAYAGTRIGLPFLVAAALAVVVTGLIAGAIEIVVFRRLQNIDSASKMMASIGGSLAIKAMILIIFGGGHVQFPLGLQPSSSFFGALVTPVQGGVVITALAAMAAFQLLLVGTMVGRRLRATADNMALAEARGIDAKGMILLTWCLCGGFAAITGVALGAESQVRPNLGGAVLLPVFAALTIGGLGHSGAWGAVFGASLVAFAQNAALAIDFSPLEVVLPGVELGLIPTGYKEAVALVVIIGVLMVWPQGILTRRRGA